MTFKFSYLLILFGLMSSNYAETHRPQEFLKSIQNTPNEGEQIYNHFCVNCHAVKPLISLGAPRYGEQSDWAARLKQGAAILYQHTDEGFNAMPARGGCFECSERQLCLAIVAMVPKSSKKELLNELKAYKKYKE